jgi:hypothetical protein
LSCGFSVDRSYALECYALECHILERHALECYALECHILERHTLERHALAQRYNFLVALVLILRHTWASWITC